MKAIKNFSILVSLLTLGSCDVDRYLDIYPENTITEGNFYTSEAQLQQALNDVYRQLGRAYDARSLADYYGELASDNTQILSSSGGDGAHNYIINFTLRPDKMNWDDAYNGIFVCNNIIEILEATTIITDSDRKAGMIGEARLIRALLYFNLVRIFGDVPLVTKTITADEGYDYLRESAESVYGQIIDDLLFAKMALPEAYAGEDVGRATSYAAAAILAKVYLTKGNPEAAESELAYIIGSGRYSLDANNDGTVDAEDYRHLFAEDTKNCKSSILEVQYMSGLNAFNSQHQNMYTPFNSAFHLPGQTQTVRGEGMNTPTDDLIAEFEAGDPRLAASIEPGYIDLTTGLFVEYPYTRKFYDSNILYAGQNFEIIRYADVLLMHAEVTGDPTYLNMVRARAGLPAFGSASYPSDLYPTLERAIEHERRVELCFEFHRFFDLVRTGRAVEVMKPKGYNITQEKLLFPVPQDAIDVNPKLTQNPGY